MSFFLIYLDVPKSVLELRENRRKGDKIKINIHHVIYNNYIL